MRSKERSLNGSLLQWLGQAGQVTGLPCVEEVAGVESHRRGKKGSCSLQACKKLLGWQHMVYTSKVLP